MVHVCEKCNVEFKKKCHYQTHLKSQRHLNGMKSQKQFACDCGKVYRHSQSLWTHKKTCDVIKNPTPTNTNDIIQEYEEKLKQSEIEKEELRKQISELLEKQAQSQTINNIENQQNIETQNTVNIHINAFGNENMEHITEKVIIYCINHVYNSIPLLIERIHFDPDHPENHNIKITNKKLPHASIMTDKQTWKTVDRNRAIESMVDKGFNILDESYTDNRDKISANKQKHFEGFQSKYSEQDKELLRQLKTEMELLVLNGTREK